MRTLISLTAIAALGIATLAAGPAVANGPAPTALAASSSTVTTGHDHGKQVRFSTFNASLNRNAAGQLITDLAVPGNVQAANVAETIQRVRPDVLLINEFDFDSGGTSLRLFQDNYLSVAHNGATPIGYDYRYTAPVNTGVASGFDLNNDGKVVTTPLAAGYGDDALGFGQFEGQYGLAVYSKYPIDKAAIRSFQHFLWKDMPGALLPEDASTPGAKDWYSPAEQAVMPLSSKTHLDVPIRIGRDTVHFLVSHPTPPVFDGAEDRNGKRNHDEIRFWADYVSGNGRYIYDDNGDRGGLSRRASFVIAGDLNSDPIDGDSVPGATDQLLKLRQVNTATPPTSAGAVEASQTQGELNLNHKSPAKQDTADFCDTPLAPPCSGPGNLRADYVLPSKDLKIKASGVFWPTSTDPLFRLTGAGFPVPTSDHRETWVDVLVK